MGSLAHGWCAQVALERRCTRCNSEENTSAERASGAEAPGLPHTLRFDPIATLVHNDAVVMLCRAFPAHLLPVKRLLIAAALSVCCAPMHLSSAELKLPCVLKNVASQAEAAGVHLFPAS